VCVCARDHVSPVAGIYGYSAIEAVNFCRTRVVSESRLKDLGKNSPLGLFSPDVFQVTLLGAVIKEHRQPRRRRHPVDLLYCISSHCPQAKIRNILQWSGTILSASRCIFLGKLHAILVHFDPALLELTYCDTDSAILSLAHEDLRDCIKPQHAHLYDDLVRFLMEEENPTRHQAGKFKLEYEAFDVGYFRTGKCYLLQRTAEAERPELDVRRMRSVPRRHAAELEPRHYWLNPLTNSAAVRGLTMTPTLGMEVAMMMQGRTIGHSYNLKRKCLVRVS
jgi:hypothetical protein